MKFTEIAKLAIKLFFSIFVLVIIYYKIDIHYFFSLFSGVSIYIILLTILTYYLCVFLGCCKLNILLKDVILSKIISASLKAVFYSTVLPGQIFGEVSKIALLANDKADIKFVGVGVLFDKMTGLIAVITFGIVGVLFSEVDLPNIISLPFAIFMLVISLAFIIPYIETANIYIKKILLIKTGSKYIEKFKKFTYELYSIWYDYIFGRTVILKFITYSFIIQLIGIFQVYIIGLSLNINVSFVEYMWIMSSLALVMLLPISFAGLGLREATIIGFLLLFDVPVEKSIVISIVIFISQLFFAIIGFILILKDQIINITKYVNMKFYKG